MADEFKPVEGARRLEERIARDEDMGGVEERLKAAEEEEQAAAAPAEAAPAEAAPAEEAPKKAKKKADDGDSA